MNKLLYWAACLLGAVAIVWMGASFVGEHALALAVTALIAVAYGIGVTELLWYRRATASLERALSKAPAHQGGADGDDSLPAWLEQLDTSLRHAVRQRIELGQAGLPAPVFTPYLVGLLVMLGLLGTFFGMVDTLSGAVIALQGNTELEAIRAGLAAPIAGLGVAFGTSVAGVAASAMLGLASTLSRRERLLAGRELDTVARRAFPHYAVDYRRQRAFDAMQAQSAALPAVVERLDALTDKLARMGSDINDTLTANQTRFHEAAGADFNRLAETVGVSLQQSLAESGRLAGESIRPPLEQAMARLLEHSERSQSRIADLSGEQLSALSARLAEATTAIESTVREGTLVQSEANSRLVEELATTLSRSTETMNDSLSRSSSAMTESLAQTAAELGITLSASTDELGGRLAHAAGQFDQQLTDTAGALNQQLSASAAQLHETLAQSAEGLDDKLTRATAELVRIVSGAAEDLSESQRGQARELVEEVTRLLGGAEELVKARVATEEQWLEGHQARIKELSASVAAELRELRDAEAARGEAAIARLAELESVVAGHLSGLGRELEAPMARLIETASETPRAAAEVIAKLREELSNSIERDNQLLEERQLVLDQVQTLMAALENASSDQRDAVARMVESSAGALEQVGERFGEQVDAGVARMSALAGEVAGGAGEVASLGEAFGQAVAQFSDSNQALIDSLDRIEQAMDQSSARSDEQLAYYVAQAREIIDHSVLSQKEIIEELRQLGRQEELFSAETGAAG